MIAITPAEFLGRLQKDRLAPVYLFLGAEPYRLALCRKALVERMLPPEERQQGLARHDLAETALSAVTDDARSFSLFAQHRLIWVSNAEAALPRGRASQGDDEHGGGKAPAASLAAYLKSPAPDVVIVLEANRYELEGDDKPKAERVRRFYSAVPVHVEFPRFSAADARRLAHNLARETGLSIDKADLDLLVESLGADAMRIAAEVEKLRLYAGPAGKIRTEDLAALVPDSSASTVFALVDALGRRDRLRALALLDTLIRQGEYLPLALSFLATLFRLALVAKERGLRSAQQIQQQFSRPGRPVWRSRAEQIQHTASVFTKQQLEAVLKKIFATDRALRDARPDDRIVMEKLILGLAE